MGTSADLLSREVILYQDLTTCGMGGGHNQDRAFEKGRSPEGWISDWGQQKIVRVRRLQGLSMAHLCHRQSDVLTNYP